MVQTKWSWPGNTALSYPDVEVTSDGLAFKSYFLALFPGALVFRQCSESSSRLHQLRAVLTMISNVALLQDPYTIILCKLGSQYHFSVAQKG